MAEEPKTLVPVLFLGYDNRFVTDVPEEMAVQQDRGRRMDFRPRVVPANAEDPMQPSQPEVHDEDPKDSSATEAVSGSPDGSQISPSGSQEENAGAAKVLTPATPTLLDPPLL